MSNLAPIVLFVYNRPDLTRRTLEALKKNELANKSKLIIFSDGAKNGASGKELANIRLVREIIREEKWCEEVEIIERKQNQGLANSVISGVSAVLEESEKVIVLEDDIVTSQAFLVYMNSALEIYKSQDKIFGISGYRYPIKSLERVLNGNFFLPISSSWGWGIWRDRWCSIEFDSKILLEEIQNKNLVKDFSFGKHNFYRMLLDQSEGLVDSWAIRFYANMFLEKKFYVYPKHSLAINIGFGENSTHTKEGFDSYKSDLSDQINIMKNEPRLDSILVEEVLQRNVNRSIVKKFKSGLSNLFS